MSLYDKYNVNPYIKTYVGAPVQAFQNTAGQLQKKYYDTIDRSNVMKQGLSKLQSMSGDQAYLEQIKAKYEGNIEQMLENPELANRAVRTLAGEFMIDKDLQLISKNKAAFDKIEKELVDKKASHIQRAKFQDAIDRYNIDGGAAGGQAFTGMAVYEEQDLMDEFDKLVKGIKGIESADSELVTGPDGSRYIQTKQHGKISVDKIRATALGLLNDPSVQRQLQDESNYHNKVAGVPLKEDGTYDETHEKYRSAQDVADGYIRSVEAKYYSVDDSDKLTGGGKGRLGARKGTMTGGTFGHMAQFQAEDEVRTPNWGINPEEDPQAVVDRYNQARADMEAFDANEAPEDYSMQDYSRDRALVMGHNNAFKTAIVNSDLEDMPAAQEAVSKIPAEDLYTLRNRPVDKEGASKALDNAVQEMGLDLESLLFTESKYGNVQHKKFFNALSDRFGPEVAGAMASEFYDLNIEKYDREAMYPGYNKMYGQIINDPKNKERIKTQEGREDAFAEKFAEMIEGAKERISMLPTEVVDNGYAKTRAKELLAQYNPNISEDSMEDYANILSKVSTADRVGTSDYKNELEDGINDYVADRQQVDASGILSEQTDAAIKNVLATVINDYQNAEEAPLDMISILDPETNRSSPLTNTEQLDTIVENYELTPDKIKVIGVDSQHGSGMVQLQLKPRLGGKESRGPMNITVNVDALSSDIRGYIAEDALYQYQTRSNKSDAEKAFMVYTSFGMPQVKGDLNAMFIENNRSDDTKNLFTTDELYQTPDFSQRINNAFGAALTPVVVEGNLFNFKRPDGELLFLDAAHSSDVALRMLMDKMQLAEQRIAGGYIGTPIAEPDSPDDMSNSSAATEDLTRSGASLIPGVSQLGRMPDDINYNTNL